MKKVHYLFAAGAIIIGFWYYGERVEKRTIEENQVLTSRIEANKKETSTIKVSWWSSQLRTDLTRRVIEAFEKEYPHIEIEMEFTDWNGYWERLATQAATQSLPDVMQQDYKYIGRYVQKNLLEPLEGYVSAEEIDLRLVNQTVIDVGKVDGVTYGICLGTNTQVLVYDKEVVEKVGIKIKEQMTWEEYEAICKRIYQRTGLQSVPVYRGDVLRGIELHVRNKGKALYAKDQKSLGFEDPKIIEEYFQRTKDLLDEGVIISPGELTSGQDIAEGPLVKGLVWNEFQWSNQVAAYTNIANKEYGLAFIPQDKESVQHSQYLKPAMFFSIAKTSTEKDSAATFINYFTNSVEANEIMLGERGVPISSYIRETITPLLDPVGVDVFSFVGRAEQYASPIDPAEPAGANEVTQIATNLLDQIWYGMLTPEQAAIRFVVQANSILSKN